MADPFDTNSGCGINTETCIPLDEICGLKNMPLDTKFGFLNTGNGPTLTPILDASSIDASAVTYDNSTSGLAATDTQGAVDELKSCKDALEVRVEAVEAEGDDQTATEVPFDPTGLDNITETNVQDALAGLDADCTAKTAAITALQTAVGAITDTDDQTAIEVSVTDAGGYYIADNVEDILQEVGADCATKSAAITANANAIAAIADTDDQTSLEVPHTPTGQAPGGVLDGQTTTGGSIDALGVCSDDLKSRVTALEGATDNSVSGASFNPLTGVLTISEDNGTDNNVTLTGLPVPPEAGTYVDGTVAPVLDVAGETLTFQTLNDVDETAGTPLVVSLSAMFAALTSPAAPTFTGNAVSYDLGTNTYTITDTDTTIPDTFVTLVEQPDGSIVVTNADGSAGPTIAAPVVEDDVTAIRMVADEAANGAKNGITYHQEVDEGGATVSGGGFTIPYATKTTEGLVQIAPDADLALCTPTADNVAVTPKQLDDWLDRGLEFDSTSVGPHTNACSLTVQSSFLSEIDGGQQSSVAASVATLITNGRAVMLAGSENCIFTDSRASLGFGRSNAATVQNSLIGGFNNSYSGDYSAVLGRNITGLGVGNLMSGIGHTLALDPTEGSNFNIIGGEVNDVQGKWHLIAGNSQIVRGHGNITGGHVNQALGIDSIIIGESNVLPAGTGHAFLGGVMNTGVSGGLTVGRFVDASTRELGSIVTGYSAAGPASALNTTHLLSAISGDYQNTGTVTSGLPIPGAGEYFENPENIDQGYIVTSKDGYSVALAQAGDRIEGVTRREIAVALGVRSNPANARHIYDEFGSRILEDRVDVVVTTEPDNEGRMKLVEEYQVKIDKLSEGEEDATKEIANLEKERDDKIADLPMKEHTHEVAHKQVPKINPDFKPANKADMMGVEFLGMCMVRVTEEVKAGDYIEVGKTPGVGSTAKDATSMYVYAVNNKIARVSLR